MTARPREPRPFRSEAARLLDRSGKTERELAELAGVSQTTVHRWIRGQKVATEEAQARVEAAMGIPRAAWAQPPQSSPTSAPSTPSGAAQAAPSARLGRLAALEHQRQVAAHLNGLLAALMADKDATARERADAGKAASTANAHLGRLEALERSTLEGIFASEDFLRIKVGLQQAIVGTARKHGPAGAEIGRCLVDALRAVGIPLDEVG